LVLRIYLYISDVTAHNVRGLRDIFEGQDGERAEFEKISANRPLMKTFQIITLPPAADPEKIAHAV
jgi:hypothetical protein